jgi:hypothetical protein
MTMNINGRNKKMTNIKKIKLYTILFHSFIIIGAGHGIGVMLFFDYLSIPMLFNNGIEYNLKAEYQDRLMLVGLISIIGKITLILSIFINLNKIKNVITLIGIILLWISVFFLTSGNWFYDWLYGFTFLTSIPFLIYSIKLTQLIFKNKRE